MRPEPKQVRLKGSQGAIWSANVEKKLFSTKRESVFCKINSCFTSGFPLEGKIFPVRQIQNCCYQKKNVSARCKLLFSTRLGFHLIQSNFCQTRTYFYQLENVLHQQESVSHKTKYGFQLLWKNIFTSLKYFLFHISYFI